MSTIVEDISGTPDVRLTTVDRFSGIPENSSAHSNECAFFFAYSFSCVDDNSCRREYSFTLVEDNSDSSELQSNLYDDISRLWEL